MIKKIFILSTVLAFTVNAVAQDSLSLEGYKQKVLDYNQQIKVSKENTYASEANQSSSKTGFFPKIDLAAQGFLDLTNMDLFNAQKGYYHPYNYSGTVVLTQPIYNKAVSDQYKARKLETMISKVSEQTVYDNISFQSEVVYWTASANQELLNASRRYYNYINELYNVISIRFKDGYIAKTDLLMVTTRLKEAELQLKRAETQYKLAYQNLNILMGVEPTTTAELTVPIDRSINSPEYIPLDEALMKRADYQASKLGIELKERYKKLSLDKFNPYLGLTVAGGYGTLTPNLGEGHKFLGNAQMNFSMPIFHFGERRQIKNAGNAAVNIQKLQTSLIIDQINKEIEAAWTNVNESETQISVATQNLDIAKQSLELNTFSYNEGKISILDVLSSQIAWIQAYTNQIGAYLNHKMAVADYTRAIGGLIPDSYSESVNK